MKRVILILTGVVAMMTQQVSAQEKTEPAGEAAGTAAGVEPPGKAGGTAAGTTEGKVPDDDSLAVIVKEKGVYERKRVVTVEGATAGKLYVRAREALSDWTGTDGRSSAGLDFCDKDEGVVNYKGSYYNGYRKTFMGGQMPFYTDFTLKVRCKDGRAQVTVTVPTMHAVLPNGRRQTWTMMEIIEANEGMSKKEKEKEGKKASGVTMREVVEILMEEMEKALRGEEEGDF